jgi:hypothetical protein
MSATLKKLAEFSILQEIQSHSAWYGNISGLSAEKMLRGRKTPYLYILRKGENETKKETDYYVSFILEDLTIRHQPFVITLASEGWYYEQGGPGGPFVDTSIEDVLYLMMHCNQGQPKPLNKVEHHLGTYR